MANGCPLENHFLKSYLSNILTPGYHGTVPLLPKKIANIMKQNWNQFLLVTRTTTLK